jgi:hypothetical protein
MAANASSGDASTVKVVVKSFMEVPPFDVQP